MLTCGVRFFSGEGFHLRGLVLAMTKPHRLDSLRHSKTLRMLACG